jgi:hypothetical protein
LRGARTGFPFNPERKGVQAPEAKGFENSAGDCTGLLKREQATDQLCSAIQPHGA